MLRLDAPALCDGVRKAANLRAQFHEYGRSAWPESVGTARTQASD